MELRMNLEFGAWDFITDCTSQADVVDTRSIGASGVRLGARHLEWAEVSSRITGI